MALNITKGERFKSEYQQFPDGTHVCVATHEGDFVADFGLPTPENEANAELFADSLNTANKTGLLPSELAEQNEKLKARRREILSDERITYQVATVFVNAPLALIQTGLMAELNLIERVLGLPASNLPVKPEQPATLTLSEADEAMDNGHHVAHESFIGGYVYKRNGVVLDENDYDMEIEVEHWKQHPKYQTGWRIVQPKDQ